MKSSAKPTKSGQRRPRTASGTVLGPREELLRETIRSHVSCEPYANMTPHEIWNEANRLALSLEKKPDVVRKAIYNRRNFVNKKIQSALVKFEVIDANSPIIHEIAVLVETLEANVVHFLITHIDKITAEISANKQHA